VLERSFTLKYRSTNAAVVDKMRRTMLNADPEGYCECCVVLRDTDLREQVSGISTACMIMTGSEDPATPITDAEFLAEHIPGAAYSLIPGAHLCCIESADAFARSALTFLQDESR
jgi:pimeloyl-ACP methyl ester carboxylesterase